MHLPSKSSAGPHGFIPLTVPSIAGNEWKYVKECLDGGWVSSAGKFVEEFETSFANYLGARHAVAVVNGTAALHIALLVAGVQPDDEVLVSTLTFIAPANAIRYARAWPVFVDAEPRNWQMDVQSLAQFVEKECRWDGRELRNINTGRRIAAILPVHILGHPVAMQPLIALARKYFLPVIEDATESLGATLNNCKVGRLGDIACFSFNGNKLITTGGGGMIVTDNKSWADRARYLTTQAKDDPSEYVHREIGFNYRLTNIQAAVGCAQLEQVDDFIAEKRRIARAYTARLDAVDGVSTPNEAASVFSAFWMYTIRLDPSLFGLSSRQLLSRLASQSIQSRPLWQPMHRSAAHAGMQFLGGGVADQLFENCLSLPCSVGLSDSDVERVCASIAEAKRDAWAR